VGTVNWSRKTVLVTGGCGHIGSFVVRKLKERKVNRIIIIDNFSAYPIDIHEKVYCEDIRKFENVEIIRGDISDRQFVSRVFNEEIDVVFHLAAYADVAATIYNPEEDFRTNVIGTFNMLKLSLDRNVSKFVFASSAAIYGDKPWSNGPPKFSEDLKPEPQSTYANSKLWGEIEAKLFHQLYGLNSVSLRYFSVYGPLQIPKPKSHSWAVAIFMMKALKNKKLSVYGGQQVRDFIYIEDVAEATVKAAEVNAGEGEAINIGTGRPTKIIELAHMISDLIRETIGTKVEVEILNYRPKGDPLGGYADTTKMTTLLGYTPRVALEEGLEKALKWYINNKHLIPSWI
jgi:UDP-glucose 4-epimerase/dTDP-L-rhamnose 4-epimerase